MRLTLSRFDPEPAAETPSYWDVAFDVVLSDGSKRYCPVTVYRSQIADDARTTILAAADAQVRPGLVIEEERLNAPPAPPAPDWFDNIPTVEEAPA